MKIGIFVDTTNLYHTVYRKHNGRLCYEEYYQQIAKDTEVIRAIAYGMTIGNTDSFTSCLGYAGFETCFKSPKIIEIHPPFNDYCKSIEQFLDIYKVFEAIILKDYPKTEIFIENRYGTMYSGGKFLISNNKDIMDLSNSLKTTNLKLKIVLDFPQLFASHKINFYSDEGQNKEKMSVILDQLKKIREAIAGIHIWGKRKSNKGRLVAHQGDLNTLFNNNQNLKEVFLSKIYDIFNDGQTRYFVPEVNSGKDDLTSIVNDFLKAGFKFVQ